jgi:hypothetical protein
LESQDFPDPQPEDHADREHGSARFGKGLCNQPNLVESQRTSGTHDFDGRKFNAAGRVLLNSAVFVSSSKSLAEQLVYVMDGLR